MLRRTRSSNPATVTSTGNGLTIPDPLILVLTLTVLVAASGLFLCACQPTKPKPNDKLTIGVSKSFLSVPVYIARGDDLFSKEGLAVTVKEYASGKMATKALFAGDVDLSTVADMPIVLNSFNRRDFCLLASFTQSFQMVKIITRKDTGIKKGSDLKGKKIGANWGTTSHFFLAVFLLHNGLSIDDIKMVPIKTVDLPKALKDREVDAISVWQPYDQETIKLLGENAEVLPSSEIYRTTFSFAARKKFVGPHLEAIKKFLKAIDRATLLLTENKEKAQDIIAKAFNLNEEQVQSVWNDFTFRLTLDQALLISWDQIARWAIANRLTDRNVIPNYLDYICPTALDAVKPEANTIIR